MKFQKNMKIGVSIIFLLLIFTTSISLIDFSTKNEKFDGDSLSISAPEDSYEPNNSITQAYDISSYDGFWLSSISGSGAQWDVDYYKINVWAGYRNVRIDLTYMQTLGNIDLALCDDFGNPLVISNSPTDNEFIDFLVPYEGVYYIRVSGINSGNSYDLRSETYFSDDPYEENDDWSTATDLTSYDGWWLSSINGSGTQFDDDWYMININPGMEHLRIILTFYNFLGDIDLQLFDGNLTWSVSRTSITDNEFMDITVPGFGIYYIKVYYANAGNAYDLLYYTTSLFDDWAEENDLKYETYDFTPVAAIWQYNLRQFDDDWYEIRLDFGEERLKTQLNFDHFAGNIDFEVYDSFFNFIGGSTWMDADNKYMEFDLYLSGTYYLRVFGDNFGNWYNLLWEDLPTDTTSSDDWAEENDNFHEATWLDPRYYSGLKILGDDPDWFQLYLNNGDNIDVDIFFDHYEGNLELELWDPSNIQRVGSYSNNNDEYVSFTADISGDWRIRIYQVYGNYDVYYDLDIWVNDGMHMGDDPYEFNNDPYSILSQGSGGNDPTGGDDSMTWKDHPSNLAQYEQTWLSDLYGLAIQGDEDWYAIEITPGFLNLEVKLSFNHSLGDIDMEIWVFNYTLGTVVPTIPNLRSDSTDDSEYINGNVTRGGIYFIKVHYGNAGNEYNLWWDDHKTRFHDDAFESNDNLGDAYDISRFENDNLGIGRIDYGVQYNNDYYSLEIHEGSERLRVLIIYDFAEGVMGLEIYDHELNKIADNFTLSDNEYIDYVVPSNGTYYIRVFGDNTGNTYNLFWEAWEVEEDDIDMIPGYDLLIMIASIIGISMVVIKIKRSKFKHQ